MIYLDNNATTRIDPEVLEAMEPYLYEEYGNPGSRFYSLGVNAKKAVDDARLKVSKLINSDPNEIIFTSSGSESNNMVIKGVADYEKYYGKGGNHIITSKVEHSSIKNACKFLNGEIYMSKVIKSSLNDNNKIDRGYNVEFLDVDKYGLISKIQLDSKVSNKTSLVSIIWANNETGNINNIKGIAEYLKNKNIFFHSDATQAVGKIKLDVKEIDIDALTFSGHKIHAPKGIGVLYLKNEEFRTKRLTSLIHGGEDQELGYRGGTLPVYAVVGLGKAAEIIQRDFEKNISHIKKLERELIKILNSKFEDIIYISDLNNKIPGVVSFILPRKNNQLYLRELSDKIAFSSGSACTISTESNILDHLGYGKYKNNFYRIAIGKYNTIDEIKKLEEYFSS